MKNSKLTKHLSISMTVDEFDNGYWYSVEIKAFAKLIGIKPLSGLRKDELEILILHFLKTGKVRRPNVRRTSNPKIRDNEIGLRLSLPVVNYSDIKETKEFILREAKKINPNVKVKSGAKYRLNRWREDQINLGVKITYKDLVIKFLELNQVKGSFPQAPSGRYVNFVSDFLRNEDNAAKEQALAAWHELKSMDIPKTYKDWKNYR